MGWREFPFGNNPLYLTKKSKVTEPTIFLFGNNCVFGNNENTVTEVTILFCVNTNGLLIFKIIEIQLAKSSLESSDYEKYSNLSCSNWE